VVKPGTKQNIVDSNHSASTSCTNKLLSFTTGKFFQLGRHHRYSSLVSTTVLRCLYPMCPPVQFPLLHNSLHHHPLSTILGLLQLSLPAHHVLSTDMFYIMLLVICGGLRRAVGTRVASHICTEQWISRRTI